MFLQHSPRGVSEISYLNADEELYDAIQVIWVPDAFTESIDLDPPRPYRRVDWAFDATATYRGHRIRMHLRQLAILKALVAAGPQRPLSIGDLAGIVWFESSISPTTVKATIENLRFALKKQLDLSVLWNPVLQNVHRDGWFLHIP